MLPLKWIFIWVLTLSAPLAAAEDCEEAILNQNVRIAPAEYGLPMARGLVAYVELLGEEFYEHYRGISPRHVVVDVGAGLGVFALQTAHLKKALSIAINAQDFLTHFQNHDPHFSEMRASSQRAAYGILAAYLHRKPTNWSGVQQMFASRVARMQREGRFRYEIGLAEVILPKLEEQADLLVDVFGAFYYSADRLRLLDLYYARLTERGMGFVLLKTGPTNLPGFVAVGEVQDILRTRQGEYDMVTELIKEFPDVFSRAVGNPAVLIVQRAPGVKSLNLNALYHRTETKMDSHFGVIVPKVVWTAKEHE